MRKNYVGLLATGLAAVSLEAAAQMPETQERWADGADPASGPPTKSLWRVCVACRASPATSNLNSRSARRRSAPMAPRTLRRCSRRSRLGAAAPAVAAPANPSCCSTGGASPASRNCATYRPRRSPRWRSIPRPLRCNTATRPISVSSTWAGGPGLNVRLLHQTARRRDRSFSRAAGARPGQLGAVRGRAWRRSCAARLQQQCRLARRGARPQRRLGQRLRSARRCASSSDCGADQAAVSSSAGACSAFSRISIW